MKKEVKSKLPKSVVLAADVGGTNTTIALCSVKDSVKIHVKYSFESQKLKTFEEAVKQVLKDSKAKIKAACIAAAGPVSADRRTCKLTNVKWTINTKKLPFKCILLNDFEALGYSVNVLTPKDVKVVRKRTVERLPASRRHRQPGLLGPAAQRHVGIAAVSAQRLGAERVQASVAT